MGLSYRQRRQLRHIDAGISRCDPQLAGMMAVFVRLAAGEPPPHQEELHTWAGRMAGALRRGAALLLDWGIRAGAQFGWASGLVAPVWPAGPDGAGPRGPARQGHHRIGPPASPLVAGDL